MYGFEAAYRLAGGYGVEKWYEAEDAYVSVDLYGNEEAKSFGEESGPEGEGMWVVVSELRPAATGANASQEVPSCRDTAFLEASNAAS
jgi:hypothetical protein